MENKDLIPQPQSPKVSTTIEQPIKPDQEAGFDSHETQQGKTPANVSPEVQQKSEEAIRAEIKNLPSTNNTEQGSETQTTMNNEDFLYYSHEDTRKGIQKLVSPSPEKIMSRAREIFETTGNKGRIQKENYFKLMAEGNTSKALKFAEAIYDYTHPVWVEEEQKYRDSKGGGAMGAISG